MPEVARFSVTAHQVSGTTDYLTYDLNEKIRIAGRIPPTTVWDYIKQVSESPTKEILLISLLPTSKDERMSYLSFYFLNSLISFFINMCMLFFVLSIKLLL